MATTRKKSKLTLPPTSEEIDEKAMKAMIDKGGSSTAKNEFLPTEDKLKSFTFKIYESELASIREIIGRIPKRDRQSIHDFVLSAVQEKIEKNL
jgi:hypothetical protein